MEILNVEIKARCSDPDRIRSILQSHNARFKGKDHQVDTYFEVEPGRLKIREGTIENNLIYYERPDADQPKPSDISLVATDDPAGLKALLKRVLKVKTEVEKTREIYFIDNVKFHIDRVAGLGSFVEIEAISHEGERSRNELENQCRDYMELLGITNAQLETVSYSDMKADRQP